MGYRDETEMLRARIAELEEKLAESEAEKARMRAFGEPDRSFVRRLFGAPFAITEECTLEGALDDGARDAIVDLLRERYGVVGRTTLSKGSGTFTWRCGPPAIQRVVEVTARTERTASGAKTRVRIVERIGQLAGGLFGGIVGGVGGGIGLGVVLPLAATVSPLVLALIPLPALATWIAVRAAFTALANRRARELRAIIDVLPDAVASVHIPSTRVDDSILDEEDEDDEVADERPRIAAKR